MIQHPSAVERAKDVMRRGFAWIGVLEQPELSHAALIRRFPDLLAFKRAKGLLDNTRIVHPGDVHGGGPTTTITNATLMRLRATLRNDYELYDHAVRMLP